MVSMASRARRSAQIAARHHRFVMHALAVLRKLVRRNSVGFHVRSVRVAEGTSPRDIERVDCRTHVAGRAQIMHSMTINANRDFRVAFGQQFAMRARLILTELVGPQPGIVLLHEARITMAAPAERRNLTALNLSPESNGFAHGIHVRFRRIAAVATRTGQSLLCMNILSEPCLRHLQWWVQRAVALHAGVGRLRAAPGSPGAQRRTKQHCTQKRAISPCSHRSSSPRCSTAQTHPLP